MTDIRIHEDAQVRAPFEQCLGSLQDKARPRAQAHQACQGRARIRARLARLQAGNLGDCKPLREGVQALRIDHGRDTGCT